MSGNHGVAAVAGPEGTKAGLRAIRISAAVLAVAAAAQLTVVGFGWFQTAAGGYGGTKEKIIGVSVLAASLLLFLFRRIVQDGERPHWREETPTMPDDVSEAPPPAVVPA